MLTRGRGTGATPFQHRYREQCAALGSCCSSWDTWGRLRPNRRSPEKPRGLSGPSNTPAQAWEGLEASHTFPFTDTLRSSQALQHGWGKTGGSVAAEQVCCHAMAWWSAQLEGAGIALHTPLASAAPYLVHAMHFKAEQPSDLQIHVRILHTTARQSHKDTPADHCCRCPPKLRRTHLNRGPLPQGWAKISHRCGAGALELAGEAMVRVAEKPTGNRACSVWKPGW